MVFGKIRNHEAVLKYARNMTENYKKRIKTIEKIEQNDIIKTIVRTIWGKAIVFLKGREKAHGTVLKENF